MKREKKEKIDNLKREKAKTKRMKMERENNRIVERKWQ